MIVIARSVLAAAAALTVASVAPAWADKIKNPTAIFAGLDKITGRITSFEVAIDETVQFGALQLTPRVCYTRPTTEAPNTTAFIEVDEVAKASEYRRIFGGWVFAASPGLHAIEHPVYDLWLTGCKGGVQAVADDVAPVAPKPGTRQGQGQGARQPAAQQPAPRTAPAQQQQQPAAPAAPRQPPRQF